MEKIKDKEKLCELFKDLADKICFDCSFYLCDSCFKFLHEKKANSEHKNENIDSFISIDIKCPIHPEVPINLFCIKEKSKIYIYIIIKK